MKKAIILLIFALILTGCGKETETKKEDPEETVYEENTENPVEETDEPEEDEWTEISSKNYGEDGEKILMLLSIDNDGKYHFSINCIIDEEWKAACAFTIYYTHCLIINLQSEEIDTALFCQCGDTVLNNMGMSMQLDGENVTMIDEKEWCDENSTKIPEGEDESVFTTKIINYYNDFVSENDLLKKFSIKQSGESEDAVVYQDENVIIHYNGMSENGDNYDVNFTIENLSSKTLCVQFRETSINDFMVVPIGSIEIAPGKKAKDSMKIYGDEAEEYPMSSVESLETKFHIFNNDDISDYYETESIKIK